MSYSFFPTHLNTYVMVLWSLEVFVFLQRGDRLETSESDVYRRQILTSKVDRQILTSKVDPRAVMVKFSLT